MIANKFKRYAYFSKLEYSDYLKLSTWEYTLNTILDDITDTLGLPNFSQVTLGDIVSLVFLPLRVLLELVLCPFVWKRTQKHARDMSPFEISEVSIRGVVLYTVDWKEKFENSQPSSWNDY
tara:strand:+ start:53544 stop:53906 length:363 start_codon:yes stop_codon:yes gene_type:complete